MTRTHRFPTMVQTRNTHQGEQIVNHFDLNYIKAVMADREREAERLRQARRARLARTSKREIESGRRRRLGVREPIKAILALKGMTYSND